MGWLESIGQFCRAAAEAIGLIKARSDLNNTPAERSNAEAAQIQKDKDRAAAEVTDPDPAKLDEDLSP